jgi:hypothetical protein
LSGDPNEGEELMLRYALPAAGALFAVAFALSGSADAMTLSAPAAMMSAAASVDAAQQVRWCDWNGCYRGVPYWPGPPYGLYQSYPYVGYNIVPGGYYYHPLVWPRAWGYRPW